MLVVVKIIFASFVSSEQAGVPNTGELRYTYSNPTEAIFFFWERPP